MRLSVALLLRDHLTCGLPLGGAHAWVDDSTHVCLVCSECITEQFVLHLVLERTKHVIVTDGVKFERREETVEKIFSTAWPLIANPSLVDLIANLERLHIAARRGLAAAREVKAI